MNQAIAIFLLLIMSVVISIATMIWGWGLTIENGWIVTGGYLWIFIQSTLVQLMNED